MKTNLLVMLVMSAACWTRSDVFMGPTSSTNRLTVGTNEAIIISAFAPYDWQPINASLSIGTNTYPVLLSDDISFPLAIAGPGELILPSQSMVSYKTVQGDAIKSVIILSNSTPVVNIPSGKSARFFRPLAGDSGRVRCQVTKGPISVVGTFPRGEPEFTGPVTLTFSKDSAGASADIVSYYFTEDFLVVPEQGFLRGPTGAFEITVERSADLTNWFPVVVHGTSSDQKAFYRLKISR